ncbi:DotD/TraH family lipoprotein [Marinobacter subterrani]|uniref:DotD/TraH family lipoprotein n=1 Tax=Marinobacter subterrani TaxID=1658765 RepID=UPI002356E1B6|nr:DotD/TraH family lipoprotein [Marinobacter subterrani]
MKCVPKTLLAVAVSGMFLGGCASSPEVDVQVDPAVVKLSKAAEEISESYRTLSYAESAQVTETGIGKSLDYAVDDFPAAWHKKVVLKEDYYGELEPFLRGLSRLVGYDEPQIIGESPVIPITVSLNRAKKPLAEFLVDASYQAGGRALVVLDADHNRIQVTYPN